ncbi:MAG: hypothetical protein U9Q06_02380 [Nanoarchaeota archaeon]|nr:hypothetical protein [Nanoarchaeota archaeon]
MVYKKIVRRSSKKNPKRKSKKVSKNLRVKNEEKLREDFYKFQGKVNRLEELRREISYLRSKDYDKGFEKDFAIISSRLRDTNALPELEKQLQNLRKKILKKNPHKRKSPIKKIQKEVDEIGDAVQGSNKKMEKEIRDLKSELESHFNRKGKVDSEVGFLVDEEFQSFIRKIKLDLSEKFRVNEKLFNVEMRQELISRRKALEEHYKVLETKLKNNFDKKVASYDDKKKNLSKDYNSKFKINLEREVHKRVLEELRKKFEKERVRLDKFYVSKLKNKYQTEFETRKKIMEKLLNQKLKKDKSRIEVALKSGDKIKRRELTRKIKEFDKMKNELARQLEDEAENRFEKEIKIYRRKLISSLKNQFLLKTNNFVEQQTIKQDKLIESKTRELRQALENERIINNNLSTNLSEQEHELEAEKEKARQFLFLQKQNHRKLISKQSALRHMQALRQDDEMKKLIENHKKDIAKLTERLKNNFHKNFDNELRKHLVVEKLKIKEELKIKKKSLKEISFTARRDEKKKMAQKFNEQYDKKVLSLTKSLQDKLNKKFRLQVVDEILVERKKLENKFQDLENKYKIKESNLDNLEKNLIEKRKAMNSHLAVEKSMLRGKLEMFKRGEDLKLKSERIKIQKELSKKMHERLVNDLKKREEIIKAQLQKKFNAQISEHEHQQEVELAKKKSELASELQEKAKALLS